MVSIKKLLPLFAIAAALAASISMIVIALCSPWYVINIDESLPGVLYEIERGEFPTRDQVAGIRIPENPYYPTGAPFLKIIRGMPGDTVTDVVTDSTAMEGRQFFINGVSVGQAKQKTKKGNPLTPGPTGVIPADHYFIWTPHPDSYDSRYGEVGWIAAEHMLGTARKVF